LGDAKLDWASCWFWPSDARLFTATAQHDYCLAEAAKAVLDRGPALKDLQIPPIPGAKKPDDKPLAWQYKHPAQGEKRPVKEKSDFGAYEYHGR
jgi:hypothetical protein